MANTISVSVLADVKDISRKIGDVDSKLGKFGQTTGKIGGRLKGLVAGFVGLQVIEKVGGFLKDSIEAGYESNKVMAQTNAVLKSTGGVANVTAKQVSSLATAISNKTGIDDEAIQSGANMLLTFKNIRNEAGKGNDIFNRTTKAVTDMSVAMGTDQKNAAIMLGKALNDPIRGISALSRVGITFSDTQRTQIKNLVEQGNIAKAQKLMLKEVNSEVGGSAAAQATAMDKLKVQLGNIQESIGQALIPYVEKAAAWLSKNLPSAIEWTQKAFQRVKPYLVAFGQGIQTVIGWVQKVFAAFRNGGGGDEASSTFAKVKNAVVNDVIPALKTFWTIITTQVIPVIKQLWTQAQPVLQQLWSTFKTVFQAIWTVVKFIITTIGTAWKRFGAGLLSAISGVFSGIFQVIKGALRIIQGLANIIIGIFTGDWSRAWKGVKQVVAGVWTAIKGIIKVAFNTIKLIFRASLAVLRTIWSVAWNAIKSVGRSIWNGIKSMLSGVWNGIKGAARSAFNAVKGVIQGAWNAVRGVTSSAWASIRGAVSAALGRVRSAVSSGMSSARSAISGAWSAVRSATASAWASIKQAVSNAISNVIDVVQGIKGRVLGVVSGAGSWLYGIGQNIISGLVNGIQSIAGRIEGAVSAIVSKIPQKIRSMMGIASPSRVTKRLGKYIMQGLQKGLEDGRAGVNKTVSAVIKKIQDEFKRRGKAMHKNLNDLSKRRIKSLDNEVAALRRNAKKREAVYKRMEAAEKRLADVKKKSVDYANSVRQSIIQFGNITSLGDENGVVTTDGIIANLATKVKQAKDYAALIAKLTKSGLNKTTLDQLIQAGAEGGYDTAKALAAGIGKGTLAQVNALQKQLNASASSMGKATSKTMYGAGLRAAQGLVNGLKKKERNLEKWARKLANNLSKAVRKALRIHSPSKVFEEIGMYTIAGLTQGLGDSSQLRKLKGAAGGMTGAIEKGYTQPSLDLATANARGGNTYQITVHAPVGASSADIGRELTKHISAYERQGGRRRA